MSRGGAAGAHLDWSTPGRARPRGAGQWLSDGSPAYGELLAQGEILEGELAMAADEEGEEAKH